MSIDTMACLHDLPVDWQDQVVSEFARFGFEIEIQPDFRIIESISDLMFVKLKKFRATNRVVPDVPLLVSCGISYTSSAEIEAAGKWKLYPSEAHDKKHFLGFHSSVGIGKLSGAIQVLLAATFTKIGNGLYYDVNHDSTGVPAGASLDSIVMANINFLDDVGATPFSTWPPLKFLDAEELQGIYRVIIELPYKVEKEEENKLNYKFSFLLPPGSASSFSPLNFFSFVITILVYMLLAVLVVVTFFYS